jgi:hypothetical protein
MCTAEYYPELVQAVRETKAHLAQYALGDGNNRDDIVLRLGDSQEKEFPRLYGFKPATMQFS